MLYHTFLEYFGAFSYAYLLGSVPFGLLLTRVAGLGDIRNVGSGNIGATNVLRTGNKKLAAATLLLDGFKGFLAVAPLTFLNDHSLTYISATGVVLGHLFPVWLQFKGGKGVATGIGVFWALGMIPGGLVCLLWLLTFAISGISSLSALLAFILTSVAVGLVIPLYFPLCAGITLLIVWRHHPNIKRLMAGDEHSFTFNSSKA